jgi:hypothetical protein
MDTSIVIPVLASAAAIIASLAKNAMVKKNVQSTFVITRPDGSTIKLEADKVNQDELKKLVAQLLQPEPEDKGSNTPAPNSKI